MDSIWDPPGGAFLAPESGETGLGCALGPAKSRFKLFFGGSKLFVLAPETLREPPKRLPRGQRPPEQILDPSKLLARSILDPFRLHFGPYLGAISKDFGFNFGTFS